MKRIGAFVATLAVAAVAFIVGGTAPASAHGTFPGAGNTGPTVSLTSSSGDQVFTTAGNHFVFRVDVTGKIVADGAGVNVFVNDSVLTGDGSDAVALQTLNGGTISAADVEITGDYSTAALYGRRITLLRSEVHDLPQDGVIPLAESQVQDSYIHDIGQNPAPSTFTFAIHMFDPWAGGSSFSTIIEHNTVIANGADYSIYAQPAFGSSSVSEWLIGYNFFLLGAGGAVVDDTSGDIKGVSFYNNHVYYTDSLSVAIGGGATGSLCGTEADTLLTTYPWTGSLGVAC